MNNKRIQRMLPELRMRNSGVTVLTVGIAAILAYLLLWPHATDPMRWPPEAEAIASQSE